MSSYFPRKNSKTQSPKNPLDENYRSTTLGFSKPFFKS